MAKLQSSFKNMALSLTCIALVAAGSLAGVNILTKEPISAAQAKKQQEAIKEVLPKLDNTYFAQGDSLYIAPADTVDTDNMVILHKAYVGEKWIGTAVEATTKGNKNTPFGDPFKLMVGFDTIGNVVQYVVLEQKETPGLGAKMNNWFKNADKPNQNIIGRNPATDNLTVSKDGGDIDAITASTITSRAFLEVVMRAYNAVAQQPMTVDAESGATQKVKRPANVRNYLKQHCNKTQEGGQQ